MPLLGHDNPQDPRTATLDTTCQWATSLNDQTPAVRSMISVDSLVDVGRKRLHLESNMAGQGRKGNMDMGH